MTLTRRNFIAVAAGTSVAALSGCMGTGGSVNLTAEQEDRRLHNGVTDEGLMTVSEYEFTITNEGDATAKNVTFGVEAFKNDGEVVLEDSKQVGTLEPGESRSVELELVISYEEFRNLTNKKYSDTSLTHGE